MTGSKIRSQKDTHQNGQFFHNYAPPFPHRIPKNDTVTYIIYDRLLLRKYAEALFFGIKQVTLALREDLGTEIIDSLKILFARHCHEIENSLGGAWTAYIQT